MVLPKCADIHPGERVREDELGPEHGWSRKLSKWDIRCLMHPFPLLLFIACSSNIQDLQNDSWVIEGWSWRIIGFFFWCSFLGNSSDGRSEITVSINSRLYFQTADFFLNSLSWYNVWWLNRINLLLLHVSINMSCSWYKALYVASVFERSDRNKVSLPSLCTRCFLFLLSKGIIKDLSYTMGFSD